VDHDAIRQRQLRRLRCAEAWPQQRGGSQRRAWVRAEDGHVYHLKLSTPGTPHVLLNEVLGVTLAGLLDLTPAPSALIDVAEHIHPRDNLNGYAEPGTYFGSQWLDDYVELDEGHISADAPAPFVHKLYELLAFDLLVLNGDRKFRDLLHLRGSDPHSRDLVIVDHGNALCGANWTEKHLDANHSTPLAPGQSGWAYRYLTDTKAARIAARQIANALSPKLHAMLDMVFDAQADAEPHEKISNQEREAVARVLAARISHAEGLAERQIDASIAFLTAGRRTEGG
jgi:hypothetical protein